MALTDIGGGFTFPSISCYGLGTHDVRTSDRTIDADGEKVSVIFHCPKAGDLESVEFYLGTVAQAPSNGVKMSFQDLTVVSSDLVPDEVADQYRVVSAGLSTGAWIQSGIMSDDGTDNGNLRTVTQGQELAVVMEFESFQASDSVNWTPQNNNTLIASPCCVHKVGGTWTHYGTDVPTLVLKYDDGTLFPVDPLMPINYALSAYSMTTVTTPDEAGMAFSFPVDIQVNAFVLYVRCNNADADFDVTLYDSGDNVLASVSVTGEFWFVTTNAMWAYLHFPAVDLVANELHRLTIKPTDPGKTVSIYYMHSNNFDFTWWPGGDTAYATYRSDGGVWTNEAAQKPILAVNVNGIGGGLAVPQSLHTIEAGITA